MQNEWIQYTYLFNFLLPRGNASQIQVMVGNVNMSRESPSQIVDVHHIFVHELYDIDGRKNDLAILQV
jgi:secreted trypsin-like serine protease